MIIEWIIEESDCLVGIGEGSELGSLHGGLPTIALGIRVSRAFSQRHPRAKAGISRRSRAEAPIDTMIRQHCYPVDQ